MNRMLNTFYERITGKSITQKPRSLFYQSGKGNRSQAFGDAREQFAHLLKERRAEMEKQKAEQRRELKREIEAENKAEEKETRKRRLNFLTTNDIDFNTGKLYPNYKKRRAERQKAREKANDSPFQYSKADWR